MSWAFFLGVVYFFLYTRHVVGLPVLMSLYLPVYISEYAYSLDVVYTSGSPFVHCCGFGLQWAFINAWGSQYMAILYRVQQFRQLGV